MSLDPEQAPPGGDTKHVAQGPVDGSGWPRLGVHETEFAEANLDQAWILWGGLRIPPPLSRARLKQWQHFALVLPGLHIGLAVVDAGYLRTSWCHVVNRADGSHFEHRRMGPRLDLRVARGLWDGRTHALGRGYRAEIHNRLAAGEHRIQLAIAARRGRPAVEGALRCLHDLQGVQPLVAVLPVGEGRAMYTHKVPLPVEGTVRVGGRRFEARPEDSFVLLDVHKAHYPRHTWWNWATFVGRDAGGRVIALNLTRNVNRTDQVLNENVVWVDGRMERLGAARFAFDRQAPMDPWRLSTSCGAVALTFTPQTGRGENLRLGLVRSVFKQLCGTFDGTVQAGGRSIAVDGLFGLCEDHDSLW